MGFTGRSSSTSTAVALPDFAAIPPTGFLTGFGDDRAETGVAMDDRRRNEFDAVPDRLFGVSMMAGRSKGCNHDNENQE